MSLANITLTQLNVLNVSSGTYNFTDSNVAGAQPCIAVHTSSVR